MYAIIKTGGKQYRVAAGDVIKVEKLDAEAGSKLELTAIFKSDGTNVITEQSVVKAEVMGHGKAKKLIVYKYKSKKNVRKRQGHRQRYSQIKILAV